MAVNCDGALELSAATRHRAKCVLILLQSMILPCFTFELLDGSYYVYPSDATSGLDIK